ncbi:TadE/TadG family type IV pilus assembly protein [Paenibacillus sp. strain BS8-2]
MDDMKQWRQQAGRIETNALILRLRETGKRAEGSIVIEAAIVLPLILFTLAAFVMLIMLCTAQMTLHQTTLQTARSLAAHMYPAELATTGVANSVSGMLPALPSTVPSIPLPEWKEIASEAAEWLPSPAGELASSALQGDWGPMVDLAATELGRVVMEPMARSFAEDSTLKPERISLAKLTLPSLSNKEDAYLSVTLQYEFPMKVPLLGRPILLKKQVLERVWVSDSATASYGSKKGQEGSELPPLQIVSITPTPLRPGHKAAVIVRSNPNQTVNLGVMYKSGASKARHLGEASTDGDGYVSWTWHVSGNTTPGIWQLTVTAAGDGGEASVSKHFIVAKSSTRNAD